MPKKKTRVKKTAPRGKDDVFDQRMDHFGEEVEMLGEKFAKNMEKSGNECCGRFRRTFGLVGPFLSGVLGIVMVGVLVWAISFVNMAVGSSFLANVAAFITWNMGLFFLLFLFFSYTSYFSKAFPETYRLFSPVSIAVSAVVGFWILANVINITNMSLAMPWLSQAGFYIEASLPMIFWIFLVIAFAFVFLSKSKKKIEPVENKKKAVKSIPAMKVGVKRLYRSGRERILGGVCGGIAEYLDVDPVLIRVLWILGTLVWGAGIIAYILFWIVMPRNPNHKWKD